MGQESLETFIILANHWYSCLGAKLPLLQKSHKPFIILVKHLYFMGKTFVKCCTSFKKLAKSLDLCDFGGPMLEILRGTLRFLASGSRKPVIPCKNNEFQDVVIQDCRKSGKPYIS